jgi:hypothetical protein
MSFYPESKKWVPQNNTFQKGWLRNKSDARSFQLFIIVSRILLFIGISAPALSVCFWYLHLDVLRITYVCTSMPFKRDLRLTAAQEVVYFRCWKIAQLFISTWNIRYFISCSNHNIQADSRKSASLQGARCNPKYRFHRFLDTVHVNKNIINPS